VARTLLVTLGLYACSASVDSGPTVHVHVKLEPGAGAGALVAVAGVGGAVSPMFLRSLSALHAERHTAEARTGESLPDLTRWWRVAVPAKRAGTFAERLARSPGVATAFVEPTVALPSGRELGPEPPADACPIRTPSYHERQGYLGPAPAGIDVDAARRRPGGRGSGVAVADVEGGWNRAHEDLPGVRIEHAGGRPMDRHWEAHGTAVLGEIAARDNGFGMLGIAPDVERIVTASIGRIGAAAAIDAAAARLDPGDVLLIELHGIGPRGRFLPVEYWDDVYEAVVLATARGVVVVAAAGNGAEDLDHPTYEGVLDRAGRDSGAILVGAGAPAAPGFVDRSRLDFSNYGSRVDVQGWGRRVASLDYGDLQGCDADVRKYTGLFSGTSSASPIAVGAALLVQSTLKAAGRAPLGPRAMRELLSTTGSEQVDGPHGPRTQHIGPRPDLSRALEKLGL
jgi:hypothetical protein